MPQSDPPDSENDQPDTQPVPMTEDGIPLMANGRQLSPLEIEVLREAKQRRESVMDDKAAASEVGGAKRDTEPTRYNDWEISGRAIDFS